MKPVFRGDFIQLLLVLLKSGCTADLFSDYGNKRVFLNRLGIDEMQDKLGLFFRLNNLGFFQFVQMTGNVGLAHPGNFLKFADAELVFKKKA